MTPISQKKALPHIGDELGAPVGDHLLRKTEIPEDMVKHTFRCF